MQSFNWVDIDGIRYSWDGQGNITCAGQFGYQASIAGDRLDGMEIENEAGDVAGSLYVDFAAASITYVPVLDTESAHNMILVGHEQGQQEYPLVSFHPPLLQNLLGPSDTIPWSAMEEASGGTDIGQVVQGHVLSWDSFHFDDEVQVCGATSSQDKVEQSPDVCSVVTISLDLTNQILDQLPPLHDI
ncbi:hypothetical protein ACK356_16175 [Aeromonas veronii]|uniref:hypothetical protein n=1 Tax=Aeromonas TaxID=642 RepID=UPI00288F6AD6|nr:hypothetical protein [Aeromonas veronii]MEB5668257.1 hypothetical protein [Aeromonas veronii]HDX8429158.1 hypothetical protein [Aeromonas veronii]